VLTYERYIIRTTPFDVICPSTRVSGCNGIGRGPLGVIQSSCFGTEEGGEVFGPQNLIRVGGDVRRGVGGSSALLTPAAAVD